MRQEEAEQKKSSISKGTQEPTVLNGKPPDPHMGKIDPKWPKIEIFQKVHIGLKTPEKSIFCTKKAI